jgi:hypothetical protein
VETCDGLDVHTLFTYGAPHSGIMTFLNCSDWYCNLVNRMLGYLSESELLQLVISPADYFRPYWDAFGDQLQTYYSSFIPMLNNLYSETGGSTTMAERKARITSLTNMGLMMWTSDTVILPPSSSWFAQWDNN